MRRGIYVLLLWLVCGSRFAVADDATSRTQFDAGVLATEEKRWAEAALHFEASLAESERPATRFNLILVYQRLELPLDVVRHAQRFLAGPILSGREEARDKAAAALAEALAKLAVLETTGLPVGSKLQIDGEVPGLLLDGAVYLLPGVHHLELRLGESLEETIEISLTAGQILPWPRLGRSSPREGRSSEPLLEPALPPVASTPAPKQVSDSSFATLRTRTAWAVGGLGAALAIAAGGCLLLADHRADELADGGIAGTTMPGYYDAVGRYVDTLDAIMPLALTGGALMAAAIPVGGRIMRRGSLAWSIVATAAGGTLLGVGVLFLAREPDPVIPTAEGLKRPSREAGSLLLAGALPLLTYGIAFPIVRKRKVHVSAGVASVRFVW